MAQEVDKGRDTRIDIAVNESGSSAVVRKLYQLADSCQKISPATAKSLRAKALRLGLNTDKLVQDVAVAVLDEVVHKTPHDTGQARANWVPAVRVSRPHSSPMFDVTDYDGDATVAKGTAVIKGTPRPPGHTVYISNALPYIEKLNQGYSQQAPAAFVETAVQKASRMINNAKLVR